MTARPRRLACWASPMLSAMYGRPPARCPRPACRGRTPTGRAPCRAAIPGCRGCQSAPARRFLLLARPQVGGQVVVRRQGAGRVVQRFSLSSHCSPRGGCGRMAILPSIRRAAPQTRLRRRAAAPCSIFRFAPARAQGFLRGRRQRGQPLAVLRHGQGGGQAVAQQGSNSPWRYDGASRRCRLPISSGSTATRCRSPRPAARPAWFCRLRGTFKTRRTGSSRPVGSSRRRWTGACRRCACAAGAPG